MQVCPYEFFNNCYGVKLGYLLKDTDRRKIESVDLFGYSAYKQRCQRMEGFRLREGRGLGNEALINYSKLKPYEQLPLIQRFGEPSKTTNLHLFTDYIFNNLETLAFFSAYRLADGRGLPADVVAEYASNANVLDACHNIINNNAVKRKAMGGTKVNIWEKLSTCVNNLDKKVYPHTLPSNFRRLKEKYRSYKKEGFIALIHKGFCNDNSRKVTADIERLILSLYIQNNNPYVADVANNYWRFLAGDIDIVDFKTGEVYDRTAFYENGQPITLSEATIWNYINQPGNRAIVDKFRMDTLSYKSTHGPHHHRHAPNYSFSKISMDDRDLPRKMPNGKRAKAYYAYDVASGCIIGAAYSKTKTTELFIDCLRDMLFFLDSNGFGMPLQVEVEHHLVNSFKNDLMKAGVVFPFVRWCNAGNSQEKWAETGNRIKKYGFEKRHQNGIGRFYAKLEANRTKSEKIFDEENNNYKEDTYPYHVLIADDKEIIDRYNKAPHPNQKKYKNLSRMDVLKMYSNPQMAKIDRPLLIRYIGNVTATTIRRNQYVQVQYAKYALPSPEVLCQLLPNNYEVMAYHLPNSENEIDSVYLYQNDVFLCKCDKISTYNTANSEWTKEDSEHYVNQAKYVSRFNLQVKESRQSLGRLKLMDVNQDDRNQVEAAELVDDNSFRPYSFFDFEDIETNEFDSINAKNSL